MWVYQETPETAAAKALPEAIMPTAQEEQLKQKNGGDLPETAQEGRQSIPAAFSERYGNTPEKAAVRRSKLSRETILLAAAYLLGTFLAGVAAARCVAGDAETLSYYLNCWQSLFSVQDAAGAVRLFRTEFLTVAGALTAVLFLGLSALGPLPIFLFTMLYGMFQYGFMSTLSIRLCNMGVLLLGLPMHIFMSRYSGFFSSTA